jgi:hypothetical protein
MSRLVAGFYDPNMTTARRLLPRPTGQILMSHGWY